MPEVNIIFKNPIITVPYNSVRDLLVEEGGYGGNFRAAIEGMQGTVKAVGRAVTGGWKCGLDWRWGMAMPFGVESGPGYPPPFKQLPAPNGQQSSRTHTVTHVRSPSPRRH